MSQETVTLTKDEYIALVRNERMRAKNIDTPAKYKTTNVLKQVERLIKTESNIQKISVYPQTGKVIAHIFD